MDTYRKLQSYFDQKNIEITEGLFKGTYPLSTFSCGQVLNTDKIDIQGNLISVSKGTYDISVAITESDVFKKFNTEGKVSIAVKLKAKESKDATQAFVDESASIRVDGGSLFVGAENSNQKMEEKEDEFFGEDENDMKDFGEELAQGRVKGVEQGVKNDFAHELIIDDVHATNIFSGYGDGTYDLWCGADEEGNIVELIIDFKVFERNDVIEKMNS